MKRARKCVMMATVLAVVMVTMTGCDVPVTVGDSLSQMWNTWYGAHLQVLGVLLAIIAVLGSIPFG